MFTLKGSCDCGNIQLICETTTAPDSISPRQCDCDYCVARQAGYFSDSNGRFEVVIADQDLVDIDIQGNELAEFYCCKQCKVLTFVCYRMSNKTYGAANSLCFRDVEFAAPVVAQPRLLSGEEKTERWQALWFNNVIFNE